MHIPHRRSLDAAPDLASFVHGGRRTAWLPRLARRILSWIMRHRRARVAEAELAALSDHMLADIGVTRSETAQAARRGRSA